MNLVINLNSCHLLFYCLLIISTLVTCTCAISSSESHPESDSESTTSEGHCEKSDLTCMSSGRKLAGAVMRAIRVSQFGGSDQLKLHTDVPIPKPQATEVLFRVHATGINPVDTYIRSGTYSIKPALPYTPGGDAAGIVEDVGSNVKNFKKGDRVYSIKTVSGACAEYTVADVKLLNHLPNSVSFEQGAGIGVPYYTAYRALMKRANAKPGETILVHGASGAVGCASVQMAKSWGMRVLGTAGTDAGLKLVSENGADAVFNHHTEGYTKLIMDATGGQGPDVILEMLANVNLSKDLDMIKRGGRIMIIGSRGPTEVNPRAMMVKECTVTGVMLFGSSDADWQDMHAIIGAGLKSGWIRPQIGKELPLEKAAEGHDLIISNSGAQGNIILKI